MFLRSKLEEIVLYEKYKTNNFEIFYKKTKMWNCVEDRVSQGHFGRVIRKVIFQDIYADRTAVLSEKPISTGTLPFLKTGERVAYYDNCEIREGNFLCSSHSKNRFDPKMILAELLSTEDEVKNFCQQNNLCKKNDHIFT